MSNIFITGTSSGFGLLIAKTLVHDGHTVFATMRDTESRNAEKVAALRDLTTNSSGTLHVLDVDVTDEQSVERAVAEAIAATGHLDVAINHAGTLAGGHLETFTSEQLRDLFDVNLFGPHRVCRAALPHMRERRQGLIINVSSAVGRFIMPFTGPYCSSKFALESYSETLAMELAPTGVQVAIIEPGAYMTNVFSNMMTPADHARIASYGELGEAPTQMWGGVAAMLEAQGSDPQHVADKIAELVSMPAADRPLRTVIDGMTGQFTETVNATYTKVQAEVAASFGG
jgi:NAD(P)-dependent dehydrogenase (short-subunit alcohol dehydrogenase family)